LDGGSGKTPGGDALAPLGGDELRARYDELQLRVTRFSAVEQQLIRARDRLDAEVARFGRLHAFSLRALRAHARDAFGTTVAEGIVDVFEPELGVFWGFAEDDTPRLHGASGIMLEADAATRLGAWARDEVRRARPAQVALRAGAELGPLGAELGLDQVLIAAGSAREGRASALLLAGVTTRRAALHEPLSLELCESFAVFTQQVAALADNRAGRELIERQYEQIRQSEAKLRAAEDDQRRRRQRAESASQAKSLFLAHASHEIRTPMNGVLGVLQLLKDLDPTAEQGELISMAEQSGLALLQIIDDILDLSKVEAGKLEVEQRPFQVEGAVRSVVTMLGVRAREKGLELELRWDERIPARVIGDSGRLRQVLTNIIGNATKFTSRGRIDVFGHLVERAGEPWLHLEIRDTGIGISAEAQRRLFAPFEQAEASTQRRYGGTGLGLAISLDLVRLMRGTLRVDSELGRGSAFHVELPLIRAASLDEPAPSPDAEPHHRPLRGRVLLVDDNEVGLLVARKMLVGFGLEVETAANGLEALDRLEAAPFELVLMDCQMPVLDGYSATAELRRREEETGRRRTQVVALTANALAEDEAACLEAGMDGFISKPLQRATLRAALERHLPPR
jgi:signal transduction histidine kinase/ActR/RegA family two-component response regulator